MSIFNDTLRMLEQHASTHDSVLVAFSGGKDSLVTLDLCCKIFPKVVAFHKWLVPGLEVIERQLDIARNRYKVPVLEYPSASFFEAQRDGLFCNPAPELQDMEDISLAETFYWPRMDTGIQLMATGMRASDGLKRRQFFANIRATGKSDWANTIFPIEHWRKIDVLTYLKVNKIPLPPAEKGSVTSGVGLNTESLLWLHDEFPRDFAKLKRFFPYIEAVVKRREYHGVS